MRMRTVAALLAVMLSAWSAAAQEQRASLEGTVKDNTGAVLPGATVTVKGPAAPAGLTAVTDAGGIFRFPALPTGVYEVTAELEGFAAARVENVELFLGQLKTVNLTLSVSGVTESVQVTAEPPLIDVRQNAAFANIRKDFIDNLPKGRDFTSIVSLAPGANWEVKQGGGDTLINAKGGISVDGASGAENVYVIDGLNTTSIRTGQPAQGLITDFIEEVQVKSSGYNAEFGGSMGGVINVITRSGTNTLHGDFGTYFSSNDLAGAVRPTLRLNPNDPTIAEYVTYPDDKQSRWEPGGTLGGPILVDKAWFFVGYIPQLYHSERTAPFNTTGAIETKERDDRFQNFTANVNSQLTQALRGRFAANINNYKRIGQLHNQDGTSNPLAVFDIDREQPRSTYSGQVDYVVNDRIYLAGRVGYFSEDAQDFGVPTDVRWIHARSSINFPGVPADLQRQQNFSNILSNSSTSKDLYTRLGVNFDVSYFASFAGQHTFKAGVQLDRYGNDVFSGEQNPVVQLFWGEPYIALDGSVHQGTYGYYHWRQFQTTGKVNSNALGFYVQDSWSMNDRLTLNIGLRTERERVPAFRTDLGGSKYPIDFGFGEKLAPRLGFAYDIAGNGRWKAYGSWGYFYDIMKLEMPRGAFGGDKWLQRYYTLDTPDWTQIGVNGNFPGTFIEQIDFRHTGSQPGDCATPTNPNANCIDPDLKPSRQQEFTLGLDHELNSRTSVGIRYVHKQIDYTIDDVGTIVPGVGEVYYYANPGYGLAEYTIGREFPAQPKAKRDYDGVELRVLRRMTDGLQIGGSYVWSRLYGNFSGLASSDEDGRSSPNVNRFFDGIYMSFDQFGRPSYGRLATDRPHQFKAQVVYQFKFGTTVGLNQYVASGTPVSRQLSTKNVPFFYLGRGSDGRTPVLSQTDLALRHELRFTGNNRLLLEANILNLFDQDTVIDIWNTELRNSLNIPDEVFFQPGGFDTQALIVEQNRLRDNRFLMPSRYQDRRQIRFGVKFMF
ncbi:MAG TPA: TonB-dependent receptor [Vicinamibacterales bacterium]